MELNKDLIQSIARWLDDKSIINLLSVQKKLNDSSFFKIIFNEKYPLLASFKNSNMEDLSWRIFYIRMIRAICKLKEEFDIDYIPSPYFNPINIYKYTKENQEEHGIEIAIMAYKSFEESYFITSTGNLELTQKYLAQIDFNDISVMELFRGAIISNNLKLVKYLIDIPSIIIDDELLMMLPENKELIDYIDLK